MRTISWLCGDDAAFCQITLTSCLFIILKTKDVPLALLWCPLISVETSKLESGHKLHQQHSPRLLIIASQQHHWHDVCRSACFKLMQSNMSQGYNAEQGWNLVQHYGFGTYCSVDIRTYLFSNVCFIFSNIFVDQVTYGGVNVAPGVELTTKQVTLFSKYGSKSLMWLYNL